MDLGCDWLCGLSAGTGRPRLSVVNFGFREQRLDPFGELLLSRARLRFV
jgi:hypothetical protein